MISLETQQELYLVGRLARLGILHSKCVCTTYYFIQYEALLVQQQQRLLPFELLVQTLLSPQDPPTGPGSLLTKTSYQRIKFSMIVERAYGQLGHLLSHFIKLMLSAA
jgi:hypothetical protein